MNEAVGTDIDWEALRGINDDIVGVIAFGSNGYARPIVREDAERDGYYLEHDFWREESPLGCPSLISGPGLAVIEVSKLDGTSLACDFERDGAAEAVLSTAEQGTIRLNTLYEIGGDEAQRALDLRCAEAKAIEEWRGSVLGRMGGGDSPGAIATIIWHEDGGSARGLLLVEEQVTRTPQLIDQAK